MDLFGRGDLLVHEGIPGALHMGWDAALFERAEHLAVPALLRLGTWAPGAVSLGRFQDAERALDLSATASAGIDVVRRPTGGRAVLHEGDVTYALVARRDDPVWGGGRAESLRAIAEALVIALRSLGCPAEISRGAPAAGPSRGHAASPPCFVSASREEITVAGRKLLGSARVEGKRAFLQQGSLPLDAEPAALSRFLPLTPGGRDVAATLMRRAAVGLGEALGMGIGHAAAMHALEEAFARRAGRRFERLRPGPQLELRALRAAALHSVAGGVAAAR